ncbi:MAG: NAD(P)/FAD-dependent oxidoreductase, partial [Phycisphaerae bacterium]|nr:NAD(P)/FAD-dependent oxidoreductase [Phycisphaerae bacterium]
MSTAPVASPPSHAPILILGGGAAGLTVAARLCRAGQRGRVVVVEPSETHDYQPMWTLVGAGVSSREAVRKRETDLIPRGASWVKDAVAAIDPASNAVTLKSGARVTYDWLVVALGLQVNWDGVKGLRAALGRNGVCSNYSFETVNLTRDAIRAFKGGDAVFTHPATPIKCGGAPQKIMYLADDAFRRAGVREKSKIHFYIGEPVIFKAEKYAKALLGVIARKGIEPPRYRHHLVEVRLDSREAVFEDLEAKKEIVQRFDLLHVTPPQGPLDVAKQSGLGNAAGWIDVDKETCRHVKFANVFSLGDASSLPTSKTAAAIRKQAPVLVKHLLAAIGGASAAEKYDGYTSCPLVTGYGKLILAEFGYDLQPLETFPFDQGKERLSMYWL